MPVRVSAVYTHYPHFGRHAGLVQFLRHLDGRRYVVRARAVPEGDPRVLLLAASVRARLSRLLKRRGMPWYDVGDLAAELTVLPDALLNRADILHFLDGEHGPRYLPRLLSRWPRVRTKLVATFHQPPEVLDDVISRPVLRLLDRVVVVSPVQRAFFEAIVPSHRVELLLHGIDTEFFRPSVPPAGGEFRCLTVGRWLRDWPAVRAVAVALAQHTDIRFDVVTPSLTGLEGLPNVTVHTAASDEHLRALYQQAHVVFLPLTGATANNTLLEAIACGVPVVTSDLPSVRVYLPGNEAIRIRGNDPAELGGALLELRRDRELRTAMARHARARAEELSWTNVAREYARMYDEVLAAPFARDERALAA